MENYLKTLQAIKDRGTVKPAARANMPGTKSLFGHQFEQDLSKGFPALTTKKLYWKGVVVELMWFLRGDTNIKYLDDHKVRKMWHQDAYNYYCKIASANDTEVNSILMSVFDTMGIEPSKHENADSYRMFTFEEFCKVIKETERNDLPKYGNYILGDCGYQYGKVWRDWTNFVGNNGNALYYNNIDQILDRIKGLLDNPQGRRHVLTAWDPAHIGQLALEWCHAMCQFNCRPLTFEERIDVYVDRGNEIFENIDEAHLNIHGIPKYYLDSKLFQRSADCYLGVPLNIASYSLLTHMFAEICNMIPGYFIHSFGDVHIYDDHKEVVELQLTREPYPLPTLVFSDNAKSVLSNIKKLNDEGKLTSETLTAQFESFKLDDFILYNYKFHPAIEANLSTGMIK